VGDFLSDTYEGILFGGGVGALEDITGSPSGGPQQGEALEDPGYGGCIRDKPAFLG
jgi:hypothetical protein